MLFSKYQCLFCLVWNLLLAEVGRSLWWFFLIANPKGFKVTMERNMGMSVRKTLDRVDWSGRTPSKCGWHHSMGWGPTLNKRVSWEPAPSSDFWPWVQCDQLPQPFTMPSPPWCTAPSNRAQTNPLPRVVRHFVTAMRRVTSCPSSLPSQCTAVTYYTIWILCPSRRMWTGLANNTLVYHPEVRLCCHSQSSENTWLLWTFHFCVM